MSVVAEGAEQSVRAMLAMIDQIRVAGGLASSEKSDVLRYSSVEALILAHGVSGVCPPRLPRGVRYMTPRECFSNAATLTIRYPDQYTYTEGYAAGIIPVHHAWCVTNDGTVVDPTWRPPTTDRFYLGVPLKAEEVFRFYADEKGSRWGTVLYQRQYLTRDPAEYLAVKGV